jgi:maltose alpha-D-glucosyltransferase / alpha-amylase
MLCRVRELIAVRKACPVIGRARWEPLDGGDPAVFAHRARADGDGDALLFLHNLSDSPRRAAPAGIDLAGAGAVWASGDDPMELEPFGYRWLRLRGG